MGMSTEDYRALEAVLSATHRPRKSKTGALYECQSCGDPIRSKHVHDFVTCKCGATSVDGGPEYHRACFKDLPPRWVGE